MSPGKQSSPVPLFLSPKERFGKTKDGEICDLYALGDMITFVSTPMVTRQCLTFILEGGPCTNGADADCCKFLKDTTDWGPHVETTWCVCQELLIAGLPATYLNDCGVVEDPREACLAASAVQVLVFLLTFSTHEQSDSSKRLKLDEKRKAEYGKKLNELKHAITLHRPKSVLDGYNRWMSRGKDCVEPYNLRVDKEVFRQAEDSYFAINPTDIIESLYQLKGRSQQNKVGFLHPEMITPDVYGADKGVTLDYLARALEGYEFYVTPYLQGAHYVLFIICPKHGRGFILDSQKESVFHTEDNYRLTGLVDSVLGGSLKWELPTVNRQPSTWECGYYVMTCMHDFVLKYQNDDFLNIIPWGEERRLENKELDAVIGAWLLITTFSARLLNGLFFMATSAKTAANVNGVFHEIGKSLPRAQPTQNPACMVLVNRPAEGARSASCCS
ncbi:ulp1 protease family, C-terminal catalytic domain-containing protein [Tanacetum coccineum]